MSIRRILRPAAAAALLALSFGACDTTTPEVTPPTADIVADAQDDTTPEDDTTTEADVSVEADIEVEPDIVVEKPYPVANDKIELWQVVPNMRFYDPWNDSWIELADYYKHPTIKAILISRSAGWCGPCMLETTAFMDIYDTYEKDGLEIIYTMGEDQESLVPFKNPANFDKDLAFMESWKNIPNQNVYEDPAWGGPYGKIDYPLYADSEEAFLDYEICVPGEPEGCRIGHNWPFTMLVTTKDMGVRFMDAGFFSAQITNKIEISIYNDPPNIPFK